MTPNRKGIASMVKAVRRFEEEHGITPVRRYRLYGVTLVSLIGETKDGRKYGATFQKGPRLDG